MKIKLAVAVVAGFVLGTLAPILRAQIGTHTVRLQEVEPGGGTFYSGDHVIGVACTTVDNKPRCFVASE